VTVAHRNVNGKQLVNRKKYSHLESYPAELTVNRDRSLSKGWLGKADVPEKTPKKAGIDLVLKKHYIKLIKLMGFL
jgi:hypothetical protein